VTDSEAHTIVQGAARILIEAVLRVIEDDPHQWSNRLCASCRAVSSVVGRPFGCEAKHQAGRGRKNGH